MEEKYCFLTREEIKNKVYVNYDTLFVVQAGDKCGENSWMRRIRVYAEELDGHYIVVSEDELKTNTGTTAQFSISKVEHEKEAAERYCLEQSRRLAMTIADPLGCNVKDHALEKAVQP